jgi:hypothetical protein
VALGRALKAWIGVAVPMGPMWAHPVVVVGELVGQCLELGQGGGGMGCEPFLLGLVETLDLAAGLRMVGPGV